MPVHRVWLALMGGFFLFWGGWELLELLGYVAEARFPWPLFILGLGGAFLVSALTGRGWCWGGEDEADAPSQTGRKDRGP